jgi:hypothetical protein
LSQSPSNGGFDASQKSEEDAGRETTGNPTLSAVARITANAAVRASLTPRSTVAVRDALGTR